jgi:hypothetical protein
MAARVRLSWLGLLLERLPRPLVQVLDDWSYRVARRKADRRRAALLKQPA